MATFNSGTISRDEALDRARILKKSLDFHERNPTVDEEKAEQIGNVFNQLVTEHNITPEELSGNASSSQLATTSLKGMPQDDEQDPISLYYSQPEAVEEWNLNRANGRDRDHDLALPFKLGYKQSTGDFDTEGLGDIVNQRREEFNPDDHTDFNPDKMDDLREAYSWGMDPEHYKIARSIGVPHDFLMEAFTKSVRPHTIQVGAAKGISSVRGVEFGETPAGSAAAGFREDNPLPESASTSLATDDFIPIRLSAMRPGNIAQAYQSGISSDELLDAWHNNGFHPLGSFGTNFTFPVAKYVATRGMGVNHEQARSLISSLKHIPSDVFKRHLDSGMEPEAIVDALNDYSDIPLGKPEEQKAIQE
jgi:hypothetical protein